MSSKPPELPTFTIILAVFTNPDDSTRVQHQVTAQHALSAFTIGSVLHRMGCHFHEDPNRQIPATVLEADVDAGAPADGADVDAEQAS